MLEQHYISVCYDFSSVKACLHTFIYFNELFIIGRCNVKLLSIINLDMLRKLKLINFFITIKYNFITKRSIKNSLK